MLRLKRQTDTARPLFRNRYADEWVGLLVLVALVVLIAAIIEAGFLRQWLTPAGRIHFVLPESGVAGLAINNDIEVMGVHVGEIRKIDMNEAGRMSAEGTIEPQFERYIRTDSTATIRRRFVVAGASYIELSRGQGQPLDWGFAVMQANVELNPADMIIQTLRDVRARLLPAMDNVQAITQQAKELLVDLRAGKGTAGELLSKPETAQHVNQLLLSLNAAIQNVQPLERKLDTTLQEANGTLSNAHVITGDLKKSTPDVNAIMHNTALSTEQLPQLMIEAEATADSLRKMTDQLRSLWILGGSGSSKVKRRLPAYEVHP
ncbi:MlaD family protein [Saccharibacter floricola]|uniref:ABC transporter periplasmic protein n=1 Tax=Saccharibacter floricola DSM 15669 TaxID=1123227 RepID=A0ABQ0NW75_9PROT|nr:MlaD family protein [Saccharibacter floricola]GBQ04857.1 ABC transporter periplasmic protein [Saccharibacter floricola DSM 15669]